MLDFKIYFEKTDHGVLSKTKINIFALYEYIFYEAHFNIIVTDLLYLIKEK